LLGIPVTARQMENMAITATRLGRAVGRDAASALGDLVTGIGRMSPLILDNLGITIKLEEAYAGLGENATDAQKKIAFFNAVMKKANDASKTLGDQLPTIGEKMDKVYARVKNLGMAIGDALAGPVGKLLDIIDALPSHVAVVTAKINIAIANANPINQLSRLLTPGHQRRIMDAYAREGLFDVTPQFRFSNKAQYMDQGLRERSTPEELATVRMFEAFNNGQTFDMEPQIRDMTKDLDAGFKMVAKRAKEDLNDIPLSLESEFAKSFANISLGFSAVGLNGMTSFFGNVSNLGAGINGLTGGGKEPSWLTDRFLPALQMFGQAGQAFSGAVGIFQGIAGLFGGTKVSGDLSGLSTEELQNIVNGDLGQYSKFQDVGDEAVGQFQDLARKELTGRGVSTGSNAYSVTTSISETQANSILAVLETQRAQDAERNNLLGQSLAVQTDMKFLMSINSGNLLTFAG